MEWAHQGFIQMLIQALLKAYQQSFFVTRTVHDLLWGYKDELLALIHPFRPDVSPYFGLYYGVSGFFSSESLCSSQGAPDPDFMFTLPFFYEKTQTAWNPRCLVQCVENKCFSMAGGGTSPTAGCQH